MRGYTWEGLEVETMHRLKIHRLADWVSLSEADRLMHIAHVRNEISGKYTSDMRPLPDYGAPSSKPARRSAVDGAAVLKAIAAHRNDPPTQAQIAWAQLILDTATDKTPPALLNDARYTLRWAEETAQ